MWKDSREAEKAVLINRTAVGTEYMDNVFTTRGKFLRRVITCIVVRIKAHTVRGILLQPFLLDLRPCGNLCGGNFIFCPARWTPCFKLQGWDGLSVSAFPSDKPAIIHDTSFDSSLHAAEMLAKSSNHSSDDFSRWNREPSLTQLVNFELF